MPVVIDIETEKVNLDRGELPKHVWLVVCKDISSGKYEIFRNITENNDERQRLNQYLEGIVRSGDTLIGHHILGFDLPVLVSTLSLRSESFRPVCLDTLILSRLIDYPRKGHSIEDYGEEFGIPKGDNKGAYFFKQWSQELEDYCIRDVDICEKIYRKYKKYVDNPEHKRSIDLEHNFQLVVNDIHDNGFGFNSDKAKKLLEKVEGELQVLDKQIEEAFPPREVLIREFTPRATKFGTISKSSVPRALHSEIHLYELGKNYRHTKTVPFNASSHKQLIEVLHGAGWKPTDRTQSHIDTDREYNRLKRSREGVNPLDLKELSDRLIGYSKYGFKINEANLSTLPDKAPKAAKSLAKRILLEARRRTLTEWLELVHEDGRIHGKYQGIGAWTHRMAHQSPNTANIPNEFDTNGVTKLLGKEMRQLWRAPKNRLLVGVDAEGIQLRIFAHYVNSSELIEALVQGDKAKKTDPHSYNQRVLGDACKSRAAAKRFLYALFLGAGIDKLAAILDASRSETEAALDRLLAQYPGFQLLKREVIPADAKRGWFIGLDRRKVKLPGDSAGERRHLAMSGYLQNGESVVMKMATIEWLEKLRADKIDFQLVNLVHDEWQTECPNNMDVAIHIAKAQCDALRHVGEELKLNCPLAGSYWSEDHHDFTIGVNWYQTH